MRSNGTRSRLSKRALAGAGLVLAGGLTLAGCGGGAAPPSAATGSPANVASPGASSAGATAQATQTNEGGQVTVAVTWTGVSAGPAFKVALDTHSVDLDSVDLTQLATLRVNGGADMQPAKWDAPKGGHHRSGTLTFPATSAGGQPTLGPQTQTVELVIRNVAGVPERDFTWNA